MRILVTGHDGYVGTLMMDALRGAGHEAVGIDSFFFQDCGLRRPPRGRNVIGVRADLRDLCPAALAGFHAVVHLAALSNDPLGSLNPELTHAINYQASVLLASHAKSAGVSRFVFASSCSLYGAAGSNHVAEDAPLRPLTPYGVSKVEVERALTAMADDSFSPTFLRVQPRPTSTTCALSWPEVFWTPVFDGTGALSRRRAQPDGMKRVGRRHPRFPVEQSL